MGVERDDCCETAWPKRSSNVCMGPEKCSNQHKMEKKPGLDPERNKRNKRQTKEETKQKKKKETQTKGHAMSKGARDKNERCAACFCVSGGGHYHTASPPVPCANWP